MSELSCETKYAKEINTFTEKYSKEVRELHWSHTVYTQHRLTTRLNKQDPPALPKPDLQFASLNARASGG